MKRSSLKFLADESGAAAIEYGLVAAGIVLAAIAVMNGLGSKINTKFTSINGSLSATSQASRTQLLEAWFPNSHSVWQPDVADEPAGDARPTLLGSVKSNRLPK